jgi:serine/threonine protein kinase
MVRQIVGQKLAGRYRLLKQLGQGGFGQAYLAIDEHLPDEYECVVKRFYMGEAQHRDTLQTAKRLFDAEAKALHRLGHHAQLPKLLAHFEDNGEFFLVEEYIPGPGLDAELIPGKAIPEPEVIKLLDDLLTVLSFVHQKQVIHRDIKPSNIIRRESDQRLVLIDFGAVKQVTTQMTGGTVRPHTVVIGTPGYMPSEQFRGSPKPSSDVYAVGMIGIQAITGLNPSLGELPEDESTGEILWQEKANVSPELSKILSKMVLYDFRYRYRSAQEALEDLQNFAIILPSEKPAAVTSNIPPPTEVSLPMPLEIGSELPLEVNPEWTNLPKTEVQAIQDPHPEVAPTVVPFQAEVPIPALSVPESPEQNVKDSSSEVPTTVVNPQRNKVFTQESPSLEQGIRPRRTQLKWVIAGGSAIAATGLFAILGTPHIAGICASLGNCTPLIHAQSDLDAASSLLESAESKIKGAKTIEDLERVQTEMKDALASIQSIGSDNSLKIADKAKSTASTYEKQLTQLTQRIKQEQDSQALFKSGVAKASEAFKEKEKAKTIAAKDDNIKKWQAAVDLLNKVQKPTFPYDQAQTKKKEYTAQIKSLNASIEETLAADRAQQQQQAATAQSAATASPAPAPAPAPTDQEPAPYVSSGGNRSYLEPAYQEPTYQEPAYQEPAYQEPAYQEPAYQEPAYQEPAPSQEPLWGGSSDPQAEPLW